MKRLRSLLDLLWTFAFFLHKTALTHPLLGEEDPAFSSFSRPSPECHLCSCLPVTWFGVSCKPAVRWVYSLIPVVKGKLPCQALMGVGPRQLQRPRLRVCALATPSFLSGSLSRHQLLILTQMLFLPLLLAQSCVSSLSFPFSFVVYQIWISFCVSVHDLKGILYFPSSASFASQNLTSCFVCGELGASELLGGCEGRAPAWALGKPASAEHLGTPHPTVSRSYAISPVVGRV